MIGKLFTGIFKWLVRWLGTYSLIRIVLLWLTLACLAWGLLTVIEQLSTSLIFTVITLGLLAGWLLGRTKLRGWGSGLIAFFSGFIGLILTVGRIGGPLLAVPPTFGPLAVQLYHCTIWPPLKAILPCPRPDFGPLFEAWGAFITSIASLTVRLSGWFRGIAGGIPVFDPLITAILWGLTVWLVVTWAAWWMRRRGATVVGLFPALALLAYNVYYTNNVAGIIWLVWTTGGIILMQALDGYMKSDRRWVENHMARVGIEVNMLIAVVLLGGGFMLAGGILPSISIIKIRNELQDMFQSHDQNLAKSLGLQQTPQVIGKVSSTAGGISISASHAVGAGPHLSQEVVMYVSVDGYKPPPPPEVARAINAPEPDVRYYWRVQTYDSYNGRVWIDDAVQTQQIAANTPYHPNLVKLTGEYQEVRQKVERLQHMDGSVFAAGNLVSLDQLSLATWRASDDLIDAQTGPDQYTAVSRIPYVTVAEMRAAGTNFPDAIRNRYLTLPDTVPQRVRDLALDLTANQVTIYDRAMAIQTYLRQFSYSLDVPAPPRSREVTDYFLFDLKKGYCDYFATSMVVLARAAGLPARLVTGYSTGDYDYTNNRFVVVQANAHAWVEIYFPNIGWVEFEPTTNLNPIPHPGEAPTSGQPVAAVPTPAPQTSSKAITINWAKLRGPLQTLGWIAAGIILLLALLPFESWLLYFRPADQAVEAIYQRLYRRGASWGIEATAARTPHEFTAVLTTRLKKLAKNERLTTSVSSARADLDWLTGLYTRLLFSQEPPTQDEHHQAVQAWVRLNWRLLWLRRRKI
jgi:transglutaminase-like putative cysteine protease